MNIAKDGQAKESTGNVTSLDGERTARKRITRAQSLMHQCRGRLREHMAGAIPGIMDQVDDALFDLSEKADTNKLQSVYFEAMRSVRLCRESIQVRFMEELEVAVEQRMKSTSSSKPSDGLVPPSAEAFTLVDQDELEEDLAARNISGKIRNVCHEELFALDRRVALLLGFPNLEGEENPIGPDVLGAAARGAVSVIESTLEIRLLVLKLFDRHLCRAAEQYYNEVNVWLVQEGVLPDVRAGIQGKPTRPGAPQRSASTPQPASPGADGPAPGPAPGTVPGGAGAAAGWESFHAAGELAAGSAASAGPGYAPVGPLADGAQGPSSGYPVVHNGAGIMLPAGPRREEMLGVLDQVMRMGGASVGNGEFAHPERERFIGDLTDLQRTAGADGGPVDGNLIRELRASGAVDEVSHADSLMIDVVAMMFDYILQDRNVGSAMRALVGRLQIPVLKVAILDKNFFARRTHPARVFINTLAEFGARDEGNGTSPVFGQVRTLVERILDEFETEVDVFAGALDELETILGEDEHATEENAWASAKVAEERERLNAARRRAEQEVETRLEEESPPECVADFVRDHWRHLMAERLFRNGEDSEEWRATLVTVDRLLWSVQPKRDKESRDRLLALLPFLLEQLKLGMHEMGLAADLRAPYLRAFADLHVAALKDPEVEPVAVPDPVPAAEHEPDGSELRDEVSPEDSLQASEPRTSEPRELESPDPVAERAPVEVDPQVARRTATLLRNTVVRANKLVWDTAAEQPQCQGMGATVVAVKLEADHLVCVHAGDSRLYRLRDGELVQLSRDHTYRNEVMEKGGATEEEVARIGSNLITRAVGGDSSIDPEVNAYDTCAGDLFMLCSDGLSDMVDDDVIATLMTEGDVSDLEFLASDLIDAANTAGGKDNISVGLLRLDHALPAATDDNAPDYGELVTVHGATNPGRRRAHNEDAIEVDASRGCVVLADGMGGHNAGEVASAMVVNVLMEAFRPTDEPGVERDVVDRNAETDQFDFGSINAEFWGDAVEDQGNTALYDAVAEEVESIVMATHDDLDCFDVDAPESNPASVDSLQENAERDPLLNRVLQLHTGVWVEFGEEPGEGQRARLAWISPEKNRYLFTDRFGQKVSESTAYGLALELRGGRLRVLNVVPLFDRVVNRVSRTLKSDDVEQSAEVA